MEDSFRQIKGVTQTTVGYAGGRTNNPTYGDVCSGSTGHAEVVEVKYDPAQVSLEQLMKAWFALHDPTGDMRSYHGGQYRSLVYWTSKQQEDQIKDIVKREQGYYHRPIVSQMAQAPAFWRAEEYHQQYYSKHKARACGL